MLFSCASQFVSKFVSCIHLELQELNIYKKKIYRLKSFPLTWWLPGVLEARTWDTLLGVQKSLSSFAVKCGSHSHLSQLASLSALLELTAIYGSSLTSSSCRSPGNFVIKPEGRQHLFLWTQEAGYSSGSSLLISLPPLGQEWEGPLSV